MSRIGLVDYKDTDIVATGIIRPKTTVLFFDKIWIPPKMKYTTLGSLLGHDIILNEVCLLEKRMTLRRAEPCGIFSVTLYRNGGSSRGNLPGTCHIMRGLCS
jgi:hypothetical protein